MFVVLSPLAVEEEHIPTYEPVTLEPSKTSYMQLVYQLNTFLFNWAIILENFGTHALCRLSLTVVFILFLCLFFLYLPCLPFHSSLPFFSPSLSLLLPPPLSSTYFQGAMLVQWLFLDHWKKTLMTCWCRNSQTNLPDVCHVSEVYLCVCVHVDVWIFHRTCSYLGDNTSAFQESVLQLEFDHSYPFVNYCSQQSGINHCTVNKSNWKMLDVWSLHAILILLFAMS